MAFGFDLTVGSMAKNPRRSVRNKAWSATPEAFTKICCRLALTCRIALIKTKRSATLNLPSMVSQRVSRVGRVIAGCCKQRERDTCKQASFGQADVLLENGVCHAAKTAHQKIPQTKQLQFFRGLFAASYIAQIIHFAAQSESA